MMFGSMIRAAAYRSKIENFVEMLFKWKVVFTSLRRIGDRSWLTSVVYGTCDPKLSNVDLWHQRLVSSHQNVKQLKLALPNLSPLRDLHFAQAV